MPYSPGGYSMTLIRHMPSIRGYAAASAAVLLLAGCGASSRAAPRSSAHPSTAVAASVVEPALQRLKAPPGFRAGTCEFLSRSQSDRCFKEQSFVALDVGVFTALIRASGLAPVKATIACPHLLHQRPGAAMTHETCLGRADAGSTEVAVFATATKIRIAAVQPAHRALARAMLGTIYEVTRADTES
jgi:hypothetical protein